MESLAAARSAAAGGGEPSDAVRAVNALLTSLDQLRAYKNALVLTTSNITGSIDLAFVDRADIKQYIGLPALHARYEILASSVGALQAALVAHVRGAPESLLVVEEYDKLDCHMRGFFRHLLTGHRVGNVTLARSIVVLESNTGYTALHGMLRRAGARAAIQPQRAQRELKDLVFERWAAQGCEERTDTMKMVGLVDFFLPFFPLERPHVRRLFEMRLAERARALAERRLGGLAWDESVLEFLTQRVEYGGEYPIEGGKEVATLVTLHVSHPLRKWAKAQEARLQAALGRMQVVERWGSRREAALVGGGRLRVAEGGGQLEVVPEPAAAAVPHERCSAGGGSCAAAAAA